MKYLLVSRRRIGLLGLDAGIIAVCYYLSFAVRLEKLWSSRLTAAVRELVPEYAEPWTGE